MRNFNLVLKVSIWHYLISKVLAFYKEEFHEGDLDFLYCREKYINAHGCFFI